MKKIFEYLGLMSLVCFSFFLTNKTVAVVQEVDELMVQIKSNKEEYSEVGKNATITNQYIVPGLPSKVVNVDKSYQEMKKIGLYDPNSIVYDIKKAKENLDNHLDKYIVSGNPSKRMVSFIFIVNDNSILEVLDKIGDRQVSFAITNYEFEKQLSNIEKALSLKNEFLILDSSEQHFFALKKKLETLKNPTTICYNEKEDNTFLGMCKKNNYYSVTSKNKITKSPLSMTKELLESGSFLTFEVNKQLLEELPNIIGYVESRGYMIAPVSLHIKED